MTDPKDITSMFRKTIAALDARDHANAPRWQGWFLCPCCKYPTLTVREAYEVCPLCRWKMTGRTTPMRTRCSQAARLAVA